jgi:hypothetical protein
MAAYVVLLEMMALLGCFYLNLPFLSGNFGNPQICPMLA